MPMRSMGRTRIPRPCWEKLRCVCSICNSWKERMRLGGKAKGFDELRLNLVAGGSHLLRWHGERLRRNSIEGLAVA